MSKKITQLPASAGLAAADLFEVVDDVAGTPVSQKATLSQAIALLTASGIGPVGNLVMVDKVNGNDATGLRGRSDKPFLTLTAAKTAAAAGDTIVVLPGTYAENDLAKDGVNWHFMVGAIVDWLVPNVGNNGYGIFDDRGGAKSYTVSGEGVFKFHEATYALGAGNTNVLGALTVTNASSSVIFKCQGLHSYSFNQVIVFYGAYLSNSTQVVLEVERLTDPLFGTTTLDPDDGVTVLNPIVSSGIYWGLGEVYARVSLIQVGDYGIWGDEAAGAHTANLWFTGDRVESGFSAAYYVSCHSTNYRTWVIVKELVSGGGGANVLTNGADGGGTGGRHYLYAEKISSSVSAGSYGFAANGGTVWLTCQKISAGASGSNNGILGIGSNGILHADIQELEDLGGSVAAIFTDGLGWTGAATIRCGYAKMLNAPGILHQAAPGPLNVVGMKIDTSNTNAAGNHAVLVSAAGLTLRQCQLIAPALADSVNSAAAQTVTNYSSSANETKSANITIAGEEIVRRVISRSATLDFADTPAQTNTDLTISVPGAVDGDLVQLGVPNGSVMVNSTYSAWVSAADTVTVRFNNAGLLARNPASGTFRVSVTQFA